MWRGRVGVGVGPRPAADRSAEAGRGWGWDDGTAADPAERGGRSPGEGGRRRLTRERGRLRRAESERGRRGARGREGTYVGRDRSRVSQQSPGRKSLWWWSPLDLDTLSRYLSASRISNVYWTTMKNQSENTFRGKSIHYVFLAPKSYSMLMFDYK